MKNCFWSCLLASVLFSLGANAQTKIKSVNEYIHDIDQAKLVLKNGKSAYEAQIAKLASDPQKMADFINAESDVGNASKALEKLHTAFEFKRPVSKCFGGKTLSSVTTKDADHACIDAAGFKR